MHRYLICCALLLTGCADDAPRVVYQAPHVPADLLVPCSGGNWAVTTEGALSDAIVAEVRGHRCTTARLQAVARILGPELSGQRGTVARFFQDLEQEGRANEGGAV